MPTAVQAAAAAAVAAVLRLSGVPVSYRRGGTTLAGVIAAHQLGRREGADPVSGVTIELEHHDFILKASSLATLSPAYPEEGDQVIRTDGSITRTYEVLPPSGGDIAWRWCDGGRVYCRVHTKLIAEVTA